MKCEIKKELLIGYLYEDIHGDDRQMIEEHLAICSTCREIFDEFSNTRSLMQVWPDEKPNLKLTFVEEEANLWRNFKISWLSGISWRKVGIGFAAGLGVALVLLSLLNFEASYSQGHLGVRMSILPRSQAELSDPLDPLSLPMTKRDFNSWQQKSLQLIQQMVEAREYQQDRQMELKLASYASEFDAKRLDDLRVVGEGLEIFQISNENRFQQTNQAIQQLIQLARLQESGPEPLEPGQVQKIQNN